MLFKSALGGCFHAAGRKAIPTFVSLIKKDLLSFSVHFCSMSFVGVLRSIMRGFVKRKHFYWIPCQSDNKESSSRVFQSIDYWGCRSYCLLQF